MTDLGVLLANFWAVLKNQLTLVCHGHCRAYIVTDLRFQKESCEDGQISHHLPFMGKYWLFLWDPADNGQQSSLFLTLEKKVAFAI